MASAWEDRVTAIGSSLLTLEVNTILSPELSAQKMPEVPLALHTLVQVYQDYLAACGFQVTTSLLWQSARRVTGEGAAGTQAGAAALLQALQSWHPAGRLWTANEVAANLSTAPVDTTPPAPELTNGAETFEALQWVAWAATQTVRARKVLPAGTPPLPGESDPAILSRIFANCRQLKEAALRLEQQNHGGATETILWGKRIQQAAAGAQSSQHRILALIGRHQPGPAVAGAVPAGQAATVPRLFGGTVEETARALFDHPRPTYDVDPDVTMLIRKAWDLGVEKVLMQTALQVDGDIAQTLACTLLTMNPDSRSLLTDIHKQAAKDGIAQWHAFFDVLKQLATEVGRLVFRA
jgi:hypothetical protein